LIINTLEQN